MAFGTCLCAGPGRNRWDAKTRAQFSPSQRFRPRSGLGLGRRIPDPRSIDIDRFAVNEDGKLCRAPDLLSREIRVERWGFRSRGSFSRRASIRSILSVNSSPRLTDSEISRRRHQVNQLPPHRHSAPATRGGPRRRRCPPANRTRQPQPRQGRRVHRRATAGGRCRGSSACAS